MSAGTGAEAVSPADNSTTVCDPCGTDEALVYGMGVPASRPVLPEWMDRENSAIRRTRRKP